MNTRLGAEPDTKDNDQRGREEIQFQGDGKIEPERVPDRLGRHNRPAQVTGENLLYPSEILDIKRVPKTELFDQCRNIFDLLRRAYIGGSPALRAEGHKNTENEDRDTEQHKDEQQQSSGNKCGQEPLRMKHCREVSNFPA